MKLPLTTLTLVAALAAAGLAQAQSSPSAAASRPAAAESKLQRSDTGFIKQAAQNSLAEVEASKLAQSKATHADVKSFAGQMIDDHTKANNELKQLAQAKGVELPTEPSVTQKAKMKLLEASDGDKFDRRYASEIGVKAHQDTVKLFQKASQGAKDPEVKAWAAKMLPALQHHLQMAKDLQAKVAPAAAKKTG